VTWYKKAANQRNADAQQKLGFMYSSGRGVQQNDIVAVKWFTKSANQGYAPAQSNLSVMSLNR